MSDILERLVAAAVRRVERDRAEMRSFPAGDATSGTPADFVFERALRRAGISFICEVKKASPSKGIIAEDFAYVDIAQAYEAAGADAISVLTEPDFFLGSDAYLREIRGAVGLPLLRKDFIIDPYQIEQSRFLGADALLLIAAILSPVQLRAYIGMAHELGLSCLVETHDADEVCTAVAAGARIIGVNNRNLRTFSVDLRNSIRLRTHAPAEVAFVAESGIRTPADITALCAHGIDAVLVGETLMRAPDKAAMLASLRG